MLTCERCQAEMEEDEVREYAGQKICEDCYLDALTPAKSCDPWATYTASRLPEQTLNPVQDKIMTLIGRQGRATPGELMEATGLGWDDVLREIASLRHMEKIRGDRMPDNSVVYCRYDEPHT